MPNDASERSRMPRRHNGTGSKTQAEVERCDAQTEFAVTSPETLAFSSSPLAGFAPREWFASNWSPMPQGAGQWEPCPSRSSCERSGLDY